MIKFHFDLQLFNQPFNQFVVSDIRHILPLMRIQLEHGVHIVHAQVVVGFLRLETLGFQHDWVERVKAHVVVDLNAAQVRLHQHVRVCCRLFHL